MSFDAQRRLRYLLVDDDADDREFFAEYLNARPDVALLPTLCNGEEACHYLLSAPDDLLPHAILLDQNMPRLSGLETLQFIKSEPRLRPIAVGICSTYVDPGIKAMMLAEGAQFVIVKPTLANEYALLVDGFL